MTPATQVSETIGGAIPNETITDAMREDGFLPPREPLGMKIVKLKAENVKNLSAVEITPDGSLVVIGGKNGAGKTSVLDSIMYALAGGKSIAAKPIRSGAKSGKITVELDGTKRLIVERRLSESGGTLEIRTADGFRASSPQAILDGLCGKIAFDPLEFTRMAPAKQAETLRDLVGLDFASIDSERKRLFEQRTAVNREAKALKARIDANPLDPNAHATEVSLVDLLDELKRRQAHNAANEAARQNARAVLAAWEDVRNDNERICREIQQLEQRLSELREHYQQRLADETAAEDRVRMQQEKCATLTTADIGEIEARIGSAEAVNASFRRAEETRSVIAMWNARQKEADDLTSSIDALDSRKEGQLAAASWPIAGLGFNESGVTLNGLPFEQSSSAEQLRVSVAIGLALNPTLRVLLIRDGSLLDEESMRIVAGMAQEANAQLWIERVGEGTECSVIIEDGHVKTAAATAA